MTWLFVALAFVMGWICCHVFEERQGRRSIEGVWPPLPGPLPPPPAPPPPPQLPLAKPKRVTKRAVRKAR